MNFALLQQCLESDTNGSQNCSQALSCCFATMTISDQTGPKLTRQFQLQSHIEDLLEPDGRCSLTSSSQKTLGWLLPGLLWGNRERLVHPFPFLALPRHVREEPSQKKSDLQWLLDRLRLKQCGNYGWQEGRCVVERRGHGRRNHPMPETLKEPQRN